MRLEQRTVALLDLVEQYRSRRCTELLDPARAEARETIRAAIAEARRRVSTAIAEERKRRDAEVGAVEAALATDRRLSAQRHAVQLLAVAWSDLRTRLLARWQSPATRRRWTETYLKRALQAVPRGPDGWTIEHHNAWNGEELERGLAWLREQGVNSLKVVEDPAIAAGFRVVGGHNVLDATLDGLLADRAQIEGRLLHHLDEERG
jgi:uncharacterized protein YecE (DUF72 family)